MGTLRLTIQEAAKAKNVENPFALSRAAGIGYAICHRLWNGKQTRIDLSTFARLCDSLNCQPADLLTYEKDISKKSTQKTTTPKNKVCLSDKNI